jgi:hypothetical protein
MGIRALFDQPARASFVPRTALIAISWLVARRRHDDAQRHSLTA